MTKFFLIMVPVFGFLSVGLGAFGAHGLKEHFTKFPNLGENYKTAVLYQMYHTLALFIVVWLTTKVPTNLVNWVGYLFIFGILVFSGSLYIMSITGIRWLGAITPIGGLSFLLGWICLVFVAWRNL